MLLRRARQLIEGAFSLEEVAASLAQGLEAEVVLAVDQIFSPDSLARGLETFSLSLPHVRVQLHETVLNGGIEMLHDKTADIVVSGISAKGFLGEPLGLVHFIAVAHPEHPLHRLGRELTPEDLRGHRHLLVRDSGRRRERTVAWQGADNRWTLSHKATAIRAACMGMGFTWYPREVVREELASGQLRPLPLVTGAERAGSLYLVHADRDGAGPGARRLAELLREAAAVSA
jgi:DNA-binding transcriptional LysR family regulator